VARVCVRENTTKGGGMPLGVRDDYVIPGVRCIQRVQLTKMYNNWLMPRD